MNTDRIQQNLMYEKDGVFVYSDSDGKPNQLYGGLLRIVEKPHGLVIEWLPIEEAECHLEMNGPNEHQDWALVNTLAVGYKPSRNAGQDSVELKRNVVRGPRRPITCDLVELKSFKVSSSDHHGWPHVMLIQKDGTTHPILNFHNGGIDEFLKQIDLYLNVKKSNKETGLYLVTDPKIDALQRSFNELQLFPERTADAVSKFFRDPYTATLGGFSKVTNFFSEALLNSNGPNSRPDDEMVEILHNSFTGFDIGHLEEHDYEVISASELGALPKVSRGCPLSPEAWTQFLDSEGRIEDVPRLLEIIFRGGIAPSIRSEVWKFLLGYYEYDSTYKSRQETKKKKVDDYFRMKLQWKSISSDQEERFSKFRDHKNIVDKDVTRTDRSHPSFAGEKNDNIQLLYDILVTYCMYNFDLGYVQGMSDLLSPILVVMENEVDAFWSFANFMDRVGHNFEMDQQGIKLQLKQLQMLLGYYDPEMMSYLESRDSDNLYFCFRWLLIIFKREFQFPDIMRLWEVLWSDLPCKNFHLLFCLAILDAEKHTLIENKFGFTEILKRMNDLSQHIPLEETLCKAEAIFLQIKECSNVPQTVRDILGLPQFASPNLSETSSDLFASNGTTELLETSANGLEVSGYVPVGRSRTSTMTTTNQTPRDDDLSPYSEEVITRLCDSSIEQQYL